MNRITKMGVAAVFASALASTAQAQVSSYSNGDLLLGFSTPSSTGDLVIDLGKIGSLPTGSLSGDANSVGLSAAELQAQLTSLYGGMGSVSFGVVAGFYASAANNYAYSTVAHGATAPILGNVGQLYSAAATVGSTIDGSGTPANQQVTDPTAGYGTSWTEEITKASSVWVKNGTSPAVTTPSTFTSGSVVEDLYGKVNGVETLEGTITLQSTGEVDWNPATAVPEPTTFGVFAGLGLLALAVRRQFVAKSA